MFHKNVKRFKDSHIQIGRDEGEERADYQTTAGIRSGTEHNKRVLTKAFSYARISTTQTCTANNLKIFPSLVGEKGVWEPLSEITICRMFAKIRLEAKMRSYEKTPCCAVVYRHKCCITIAGRLRLVVELVIIQNNIPK